MGTYSTKPRTQETLNTYKSQGKNLQSEIDRLNANINKLNLQLKAVNLSMQKLDNEIRQNQGNILTTEEKIDQNKETLTRAVQNIYTSENSSIVEIAVTDTIPVTQPCKKLKILSVADVFADVINKVYNYQSISTTFIH